MAAQAATIDLDSSAATTTNNSGNPTLDISRNSAWALPIAGSSWISDAQTGDPSQPGFTVLPDGTNVLFSQSFFLNGTIIAADLTVLADDTTSVVVNGTTIFAADLDPAGGFPKCSAEPIGCLKTTEETFTLAELSPYLLQGTNTISFDVYQESGSSFGLDYKGRITASDCPEPASVGLIGAGLVFLGLASRRLRMPSRASERVAIQ
jgi:hypothetical protein